MTNLKHKEAVAVVASGGVFPGAADLETFWDNLRDGRSGIRTVPPARWQIDPAIFYAPEGGPDRARSLKAGLIDTIPFPPEAFDLTADDLAALDPLHQLVLSAGKQAWDDCRGQKPDPRRVGVILAAIALPTEGASRLTRRILGRIVEEELFPGARNRPPPILNRTDALAARVTAYPGALLAAALGFGGGSFTLDAACASSLFAVKLACDALLDGQLDAVLAGGVARTDILYTQIGFTQLQALSPSGCCAPFDRRADGLVVGEGCGLVVLKRLSDALSQGDEIQAVIRGLGLSNDMGGSHLAPDVDGQLRAMRAAYAAAGWKPSDVDLIECHGAGTPLGDRVELESLAALWAEAAPSAPPCPIGSVKSMTGHLLTGAGAAGLIKVLLALKHRTLPPSFNFTAPHPGSPLEKGTFKVQTQCASWQPRAAGIPRRAAVSAFGFGGINAHLLLEEFPAPTSLPKAISAPAHVPPAYEQAPAPSPVAVVGMQALFGRLTGLASFQKAVFNGEALFTPPSDKRLKAGRDLLTRLLGGAPASGNYLEQINVPVGAFGIPPIEIEAILPQHLLMLGVAADALADAGLPLRAERPRAGAVIGMSFDLEDTNFHLRWQTPQLTDQWRRDHDLSLPPESLAAWIRALQQHLSPPLNHSRTLGSLGSLMASRIARAFGFGGPCFVLSAEEASGLQAVWTAMRLLQNGETDLMVAGAVDLPGDIRRLALTTAISAFSGEGRLRSLDRRADGTLPGEGAAAVVLKRLTDAQADGDRVYAVIRGCGAASGRESEAVLSAALQRGLAAAQAAPESISLVETHGSGHPADDRAELDALMQVFTSETAPIALGTVKSVIGHAGAAAGMAGLVKTALCLYHRIIPPLPGFLSPPAGRCPDGPFHFPIHPMFWLRNRINGPRRACVQALTDDGNRLAMVVEEPPETSAAPAIAASPTPHLPIGAPPCGLFIVEAENPERIQSRLHGLHAHIARCRADQRPLAEAACAWYRRNPPQDRQPMALSIAAATYDDLDRHLAQAPEVLARNLSDPQGRSGCFFNTSPLGAKNCLAFVYPGAGNHYLGMGRELGARWPDVPSQMDRQTARLMDQTQPDHTTPFARDWSPGCQAEALRHLSNDPFKVICAQVVFGCQMTILLEKFGLKPDAVIGYSLGETVGYFATGAWPDRGRMLERLEQSALFRSELAGDCTAVREAWRIARDQPFRWRSVLINRSGDAVRDAIRDLSNIRLLIVNAPDECVIGGNAPVVATVIERLGAESVDLEGTLAVHCDAVRPVAQAYRALHLFPTTPPAHVRYYSCAESGIVALDRETAADSLLRQALEGFDFRRTIRQAHRDGIRLFVEVGPQASCTRMIRATLGDRPFRAVAASVRDVSENLGVARLLAVLAAERVPLDLSWFFPADKPPAIHRATVSADNVARPCGGSSLANPPPPMVAQTTPVLPDAITDMRPAAPSGRHRSTSFINESVPASASVESPPLISAHRDLLDRMQANLEATGQAHRQFLSLSATINQEYARALELETRILAAGPPPQTRPAPTAAARPQTPEAPPPLFSRQMCMAFATGLLADVLGPEFAVVDGYRARVRLPDEPLMLVDRILSIEGLKGALGPGRIVTEHDVRPNAWYLDADRAPVCIAVEAGQADLFLCSYLGIDLQVKGERTYRLLDAAVTFHRGLPRPGEVIRYEIAIQKFIQQGPTWMFFFHFDGYIGDAHLITMRDGCAGFFTEDEVRRSGGILLTAEDTRSALGKQPEGWRPPVPLEHASYDDQALEALRRGEAEACFGPGFRGLTIPPGLRLPGGRLRLLDRVLAIDPQGGRFGLGRIRAQADIHPDDWFLTCHFVDDMVMPGTLMYECCAHTLRILLQRMGWFADGDGIRYEPVPGQRSVLKCRGPVTPRTRQVVYEVELCEIGFNPHPYVLADAHMFADGQRIVMFRNMSMQLSGLDRAGLESFWQTPRRAAPEAARAAPRFSRAQILEFAQGRPSLVFGPDYTPFDHDRFIARLPAPPYAFIQRVMHTAAAPNKLAPGGWVETEWDLDPNDWYFRSNRAETLPLSILMEIALQACGFLAAYMGSALLSEKDLHFRNLDGTATLKRNIPRAAATLRTRAELQTASRAGDMIIEQFAFEVRQGEEVFYEGQTSFGFFTKTALNQQVGLRDAEWGMHAAVLEAAAAAPIVALPDLPPLTPDAPEEAPPHGFSPTGRALRMIDRIEAFQPQGGPHGLGYIHGSSAVDPAAWFFAAHFHQDPVCPGSLGIEALIQLLRHVADHRWPALQASHTPALLCGAAHVWRYRGQIRPQNRRFSIEAVVTEIEDGCEPILKADGYLKVDGLCIYKLQNFGIQLLQRASAAHSTSRGASAGRPCNKDLRPK